MTATVHKINDNPLATARVATRSQVGGLTAPQLAEVEAAALTLPPSRRGEFMATLRTRLGDAPTDYAVQCVIATVLEAHRFPNFIAR